jgi:DNA-binding transcriptional ArsR family regulator
VTKHLRVLEDVRIVHSVKSGRESRYELDVTPLLDLKSYVELVSARWDTALGRLKALVER